MVMHVEITQSGSSRKITDIGATEEAAFTSGVVDFLDQSIFLTSKYSQNQDRVER